MSLSRIRLIFTRELRDQVRDRRTMFTIFVLPLLLYPFMGMLMLQVAQFHSEHPVRITWIGEDNWPTDRPLVSKSETGNSQELIRWNFISQEAEGLSESDWHEFATESVKKANADLVFVTGSDVLKAFEDRAQKLPFKMYMNQASDQSVIATQRLNRLLDDWQRSWLRDQLVDSKLDPEILKPIDAEVIDIAPQETKQALIWSKILPLVMLIWALTGAFYPAIDLCAGEKERGTLETLLSSPASRREIVWGKLLTVMTFSVATAVLNLFSMQFTSSFVIDQFTRMGATNVGANMGPLPLSSLTWLIVILLPISTMFSALALAVAALARSSKEGQYYLMPLLMGGLPLVLLPMIPGMALSVGSSAIPVTGAVLLARALIEGQYREAMVHAPIVIGVTIICCLLSVRWAVRQFESENVMFRESERFQWSLWLKRLWEDRTDSATANEALLCGMIVLVALFFGKMSMSSQVLSWSNFAQTTIAVQLGLILGPCLIMALFMTSSLRKALRLEKVYPLDLVLAVVLGFSLHPAYLQLSSLVQQEFQIGAETREVLHQVDGIMAAAPLWSVLLVFAVIPAICEELTFRGFIFGGLMQQNGILRAILVSSLFFGFSHGVLQQSISASIMGFVLGFLAWRSGGVLCGIATHMTHNGLSMVISRFGKESNDVPGSLSWMFETTSAGELSYSSLWLASSIVVSILCFAWFTFRPQIGSLRKQNTLGSKVRSLVA
jgi:sodium transport system permease protein